MKVLCFADCHGREKFIDLIVENSKKADIVVCAGDLSDFGKNLEKLVKKISSCSCPVLIINGNHEDEEEMKKICSNYENVHFIHKGSFEHQGYVFFGFGGLGFSKKDKLFESIGEKFRKTLNENSKVISVTHAPPYGTKLDYLTGVNYVGNQSILEFIKNVQPLLHVCGHIHENFSKHDLINKTVVINPGPKGKLINI